MPHVLAIRHVAFEDLGTLAPILGERGLAVTYADAGDGLAAIDPLAPPLVVILGGPIGAYAEADYPFLADERRIVAARLANRRPLLGICLGCQVLAMALGARVYPGPAKEIGWAPVTLTDAGRASPLAPLGAHGVRVLHWHGDTFDLPDGADRLASTPLYANQAFAWGRAALGLQFHPEVTAPALEHWLIGHAGEIAATDGVSVAGLRADAARHAGRLCDAAAALFGRWLDQNGL
jgi:GMP synthase (glutamine-hydrolysing)